MCTVGDWYFDPTKLLGHGAFGAVFKGVSKKNRHLKVAIKRVPKSILVYSTNIQSLLTEFNILRKLHHKNIVTLHDCMQTDNNMYLVMEFCNGGDFAAYLKRKGKLQTSIIKLFFMQLAEAMKVLYSKKIVHRDLKPQNILLMLTPCPEDPKMSNITLKVADFGVARFLRPGNLAATCCGTSWYMAPEVLMRRAYDSKADLWSLGVIAYECLTGTVPYKGEMEALNRYFKNNVNVSSKIPADTNSDLKHFLIGLLKRNPNERMNFDKFFAHPFLH